MSRRPDPPRNPRWRHALGRAAEELAARHLQECGCVVLERRFAFRRGEIDLIVEHDGTVAFVEVKARRGERFGAPVEAVDGRKQRRLIATARHYLGQRGWRSRPCRFDVVAVSLERGRASVLWMRDAFRP